MQYKKWLNNGTKDGILLVESWEKMKKKATIHRIEKESVGWGKTKSGSYSSNLDSGSITSWLQVCNEHQLKYYNIKTFIMKINQNINM